MTRKTEITNLLQENLKKIDGGRSSFDKDFVFNHDLANQIFTRFKFLEEVNDFPSLMFTPVSEGRQHIGAGVKHGFLGYEIRGHVNQDDSIEALDDLIEDIEHVLDNTSKDMVCIQDIFILSIVTDEGVMHPYGVTQVEFVVRYEVDNG